MGFGVWDWGFGVKVLKLVHGNPFKAQVSFLQVYGLGFRVSGFGFRALGIGFRGAGGCFSALAFHAPSRTQPEVTLNPELALNNLPSTLEILNL